jgi:hypothetical protein
VSGIACVESNDNTNGRSNQLLLLDVVICFDLDLNLINCKAESYGGCSKNNEVNFYPDMSSVQKVKSPENASSNSDKTLVKTSFKVYKEEYF